MRCRRFWGNLIFLSFFFCILVSFLKIRRHFCFQMVSSNFWTCYRWHVESCCLMYVFLVCDMQGLLIACCMVFLHDFAPHPISKETRRLLGESPALGHVPLGLDQLHVLWTWKMADGGGLALLRRWWFIMEEYEDTLEIGRLLSLLKHGMYPLICLCLEGSWASSLLLHVLSKLCLLRKTNRTFQLPPKFQLPKKLPPNASNHSNSSSPYLSPLAPLNPIDLSPKRFPFAAAQPRFAILFTDVVNGYAAELRLREAPLDESVQQLRQWFGTLQDSTLTCLGFFFFLWGWFAFFFFGGGGLVGFGFALVAFVLGMVCCFCFGSCVCWLCCGIVLGEFRCP